MFFFTLSLTILIIDQILKYLIRTFIYPGHSIPLLNGILKLTYVQNTGAAFSLFTGYSSFLVAIGVVVAAGVIYFHYRIPSGNHYFQAALAFILGGSLGNLTDRIFRGHVVDYLDFSFWPVFNLADMAINLGIFLIIIDIFRRKKKDAPGSF